MNNRNDFAIRIADLADKYDATPKKVYALVDALECIIVDTEDRVFKEAEEIIAASPDAYKFHHVNVPKDGIECPEMWVQYRDDESIILYLGKSNKKHPNQEEIIAKYVIYDPWQSKLFGNRDDRLSEVRMCFRETAKKACKND